MSRAETQTALLARMAETRTALLAASSYESRLRARAAPRRIAVKTNTAQTAPWFLQSPNAELIALSLVALVVLGVRRTVQGVVTAGISASTHRALNDLLSAARGS